MAMKMTLKEFMGVEEVEAPSPDAMSAKMALDVQADAFLRMKQLGIKQKDLADLMGITPAAVSKLLSNGANLRFSSVARIAAALNCRVESPKLVPLGERTLEENSPTTYAVVSFAVDASSTHETAVHDAVGRKEPDVVDDAYRELCACFRQARVSGGVSRTPVDELTEVGIA